MRRDNAIERVLHVLLRPGFGLALLAAQFLSTRGSWFTQRVPLLALGGICLLGAIALLAAASVHYAKAAEAHRIATSGPYGVIRHPIYASVLLLGLGLGLIFFSWVHLAVLAAFVPLWWLESRREERMMRDEFGHAYEAYCQGKAMLIPGIL